MSVKMLFKQLVDKATTQEHQAEFNQARPDIQIALYQKLLYKAGEGNADARAALTSVHQQDFRDSLSPDLQKAMAVEHQRYAVAKASALYQDYLYQKALENAALAPDKLLFDPQGRLVYELSLDAQQQKEVLKTIEDTLGIPHDAGRDVGAVKAALKELLGGRTPTNTTLCSIDLTGTAPTRGNAAYVTVRNAYEGVYGIGSIAAIPSHKRSSIVAAFEETNAHMTLMASTYERISHSFDPAGAKINHDEWTTIRQKASSKIQDKVAQVYKDAVKNATNDEGVVNVEKLNARLGKERKALAHFAKTAVMEEIVGHLKTKNLDREGVLSYVQDLCKRLDKKHTFTEQTATGFDYLHTSDYLQQGMLITGTKDTAHNKPQFKQGETEHQAAYRQVTYTYRDDTGTIQPTGKVSARIPSPAIVFNEEMTQNDIREDLKGKFGFLHEQMRAMRGGQHGPVVENLFTSFHSNAFEKTVDWSNNRQRTSVLGMMEAMHAFNASQFQTDQVSNDFLYVQNIGTNRHTKDLGYQVDRYFGGSTELDDITLSAEMAMLHSLKENSAYLSPEVQKQINDINKAVLVHYKAFLERDPRETYFAQSDEGLSLISTIRDFKQSLKTNLKPEKMDADDLPSLASNALVNMVANNKHWDIRSGQLAQALSMYVEWASTGGCKSGNERNQDVMARFSLLTSIHERVEHAGNTDGLQEHEKAVYKQLTAFAKGQQASPEALRAAISVSVRESNMHGGVASISREDQGGAAKISSFSFVQNIENPILRWGARVLAAVTMVATLPLLVFSKVRNFWGAQLWDTNNAADREMHLDAAGAGKTQAHKGQDEKTREAVIEVLNNDPLFKNQPVEESALKGDKTLIAALHSDNEAEHGHQVEVLQDIEPPMERRRVSSFAVMSVGFAGNSHSAESDLRRSLLDHADEEDIDNVRELSSHESYVPPTVIPAKKSEPDHDEQHDPSNSATM